MASAAHVSPTARPSHTARPTELASAPPVTRLPATTYTADAAEIAALIQAGAAEAIPQLKALNKSDPSTLVQLFEPLGAWIAEQEADVAAYPASECTASAAALYIEGIDAYDAIRGQFLAWKDWVAHGHAFPPGASNQAVETLEHAVDELRAYCQT